MVILTIIYGYYDEAVECFLAVAILGMLLSIWNIKCCSSAGDVVSFELVSIHRLLFLLVVFSFAYEDCT